MRSRTVPHCFVAGVVDGWGGDDHRNGRHSDYDCRAIGKKKFTCKANVVLEESLTKPTCWNPRHPWTYM